MIRKLIVKEMAKNEDLSVEGLKEFVKIIPQENNSEIIEFVNDIIKEKLKEI